MQMPKEESSTTTATKFNIKFWLTVICALIFLGNSKSQKKIIKEKFEYWTIWKKIDETIWNQPAKYESNDEANNWIEPKEAITKQRQSTNTHEFKAKATKTPQRIRQNVRNELKKEKAPHTTRFYYRNNNWKTNTIKMKSGEKANKQTKVKEKKQKKNCEKLKHSLCIRIHFTQLFRIV